MNARILTTCAALLVLTVTAGAPGAEPTSATRTARPHFQRGTTLYDEQDYRSALAEFKRAYELSPTPSVLFNIGQCEYQLQEYAAALSTLERYLTEAGTTVSGSRRELVTKELAELRGRVALVRIETNVAGAEILVDDVSIGKAPLSGPLTLSTGRRKISVVMSGYAPVTRVVELASGEGPTLSLPLEELPRAQVAPAPEPSARVSPTRTPWPAGFVVGSFGLAAAGLGAGAVFGGMALGNRSELDEVCRDKQCPAASRDDVDALQRNATLSTIGFAAGAVGLGAGFFFLLTTRKASLEPQARAASGLAVHPWIGAGAAGAHGTF